MTKPLTNADLKKRFDKYNKRYFNGLLEVKEIKFVDDSEIPGSDAECDTVNKEIQFARSLRYHARMTCICLLHEMAHLKIGNIGTNETEDHGMLWGAEMVRLWNAGAYQNLL